MIPERANIIMHLDSALSWRGGQQQVLSLVQGSHQRNIISFLACPPGSVLFKEALSRGISVFPLHIFAEWDILAVRRLRQMIRNLKVNILHCHDSHAHTIGLLATMGLDNCKVVVTRRVDFRVGNNIISNFKYKHGVDKFIAVSEGVKKVLESDGIDPSSITVVHDGIEVNRFLCRDKAEHLYHEFGLDPSKPVIGNIAALAPHKDQKNLLQAAKIVLEQIPEAQFLVVGAGALEKELKQLAADLKIRERVKFTGFRPDIPQILTIVNIFAVSSYLEGLGSSTLEAMSAGLPIVATRTGGIPEIVENNINGILVPPRDSESLARGIIALLRDQKMREKMGSASRQLVKNFSVDKMVEGNIALYQQVINKKER